ncbi:MAG TPA: TetR/AcrR family transcriptional regulator [Verrucomicrobiae bacterium]|nr:TetR/AcrR family transcriptional regulator [Verrucomicrobiae bacterium]
MPPIGERAGDRPEKAGNGDRRHPGRPRSEHARRAILRSTLKLLRRSSFSGLTIEAIAADANVGKATVYRWWPNKGALVVDAFASSAEADLHFPNTGSVYRDISLQMAQFLSVLRSPRGRIVAALLAGGQSDPELLAAFRDRFLRPRREEAYKTLRRAIARGELPKELDLDLALDILYGSIYMRFLIRHDELSERFIRDVCRVVLGGLTGNRAHSSNRRNRSLPSPDPAIAAGSPH